MYRPRVIPCLLIQGKSLVKTVRFKNPRYLGDPLNAVRLFNELEADELMVLDIDASREKRCIDLDLIKRIGEEANMPFSVGGGIASLDQIKSILAVGAERVVLGSSILQNDFLSAASNQFGRSSIAVCIDVKNTLFRKNQVFVQNAKKRCSTDLTSHAIMLQELGAGEIILQSVERDGTYAGLDIDSLEKLSKVLRIPLVGLGGLSSLAEIRACHIQLNLNGYASGSLFSFQGKNQGVLINYPSKSELRELFD